jgi:hypothetical protein
MKLLLKTIIWCIGGSVAAAIGMWLFTMCGYWP